MNKVLEKFYNSARRNKYEIWIEILDLCTTDNIHLSYIIRELRLQTSNCKEYLKFLLERRLLSLIETETNGIIYKTTKIGRDCIKVFLEAIGQYFF